MTALTPELADALDAVTTALGDTLRTVRYEHGLLRVEWDHAAVNFEPTDACWQVSPGCVVHLDTETRAALAKLAVEVEHWCGERLAQAVEDTDWTGRETETGSRTEVDARTVLHLIQQGHITPPVRGVSEAWLWHDDPDDQDTFEMLYRARPDLAAVTADAVGWPGTLDVLTPTEATP